MNKEIWKPIKGYYGLEISNKGRVRRTKHKNKGNIGKYKNKLPYDYYKEIIDSYRNIIQELNIELIEELAMTLPKSQMVMDTIQSEVF